MISSRKNNYIKRSLLLRVQWVSSLLSTWYCFAIQRWSLLIVSIRWIVAGTILRRFLNWGSNIPCRGRQATALWLRGRGERRLPRPRGRKKGAQEQLRGCILRCRAFCFCMRLRRSMLLQKTLTKALQEVLSSTLLLGISSTEDRMSSWLMNLHLLKNHSSGKLQVQRFILLFLCLVYWYLSQLRLLVTCPFS